MSKRLTATEAKAKLLALLDEAAAGEDVVRAGLPGQARANPRHDPDPVVARAARRPGANRGHHPGDRRDRCLAAILLSGRSCGPADLRDRHRARLATGHQGRRAPIPPASAFPGAVVGAAAMGVAMPFGANT